MFQNSLTYFFSPTSSSGQGVHSTPQYNQVKSVVTPALRMLGIDVTRYTAPRVLRLG